MLRARILALLSKQMREMVNCQLVGERLTLRSFQLDDISDTYVDWMNDREVVQYTESRYRQHSSKNLHEFVCAINESEADLFLAIITNHDGKHIGNIKLGEINIIHQSANIGIIIGDKNSWGNGYATEAIKMLVDHAFESYGLHKLVAGMYDANKGSIKAFKRAGFKKEGKLKGHCVLDGKHVDVVLLGLENLD